MPSPDVYQESPRANLHKRIFQGNHECPVNLVLEGIEPIVLRIFANNGLQVGLCNLYVHCDDVGNNETHWVVF